jgi:cobalamin-dependent methionine synthase I
MTERGVSIIGERINYSIPRVRPLFESEDWDALRALARAQAQRGAEALDVNVGPLDATAMRRTIEEIQGATRLPLSLDSPSPEILRAGLEAIDPAAADGLPILNSATESRAEAIFRLREVRRCRVILLVSERREGARAAMNRTAGESLETARRLFAKALGAGFEPAEIFIDPSTPALAVDLTGLVNTALETILGVRGDGDLRGVRIVAGLSNLTASLPAGARLPLQNAFLTLAARGGLDTIIGDPARDYRRLPDGHPDLVLLEEILAGTGPGRLKVLTSSELYRSAAGRSARRSEAARGRGGRT